MRYAGGAEACLDQPAHVRAASGLAWVGGALAVIQDDASFVALVDPARPGEARAVALPTGADGIRQFDDRRGNKHLKLDLEACFSVPAPNEGGTLLVALGSGSTARREVAALVDNVDGAAPRTTIVHVPELYSALRATREFSGSELNIEGAVLVGDVVRLFGRGNGARQGDVLPRNATCDLHWPTLLAYLRAPRVRAAPRPLNVVGYVLGNLGGVPLGFTDAALLDNRVVFAAAAESSPDVVQDGPVLGSVIGVIDGEGSARWAPVTSASGEVLAEKIEGVTAFGDGGNDLLAIADPDVPERPSELCVLGLGGPWIR